MEAAASIFLSKDSFNMPNYQPQSKLFSIPLKGHPYTYFPNISLLNYLTWSRCYCKEPNVWSRNKIRRSRWSSY